MLPADLFKDPTLAERFAATLAAGSASSPVRPRPRDWQEYLDECAGRIGQPLLHFALGLPQPPRAGHATEMDTGPALLAENEERADVPDQVRARYRRWAAKMAELSQTLPIAERLLAIQSVLCVAARGAWDDDDQGWHLLLAGALRR
jgi:hypothetical protein